MAENDQSKVTPTNEAVEGMQLSLSDMIAGLIQATIDADQAVTDDYLATFSDYAFEKGPDGKERLRMVDFEMTDNEGVLRQVSIPKLSLLPLPVLHVSEATFDIEAELSIMETSQKVSASGLTPGTRLPSAKELSKIKIGVERVLQTKLADELASKDTSKSEQTLKARIHIELRPSILPNGMRGLLQLADTSIQEIELSTN